jgi:hypothetical protein
MVGSMNDPTWTEARAYCSLAAGTIMAAVGLLLAADG